MKEASLLFFCRKTKVLFRGRISIHPETPPLRASEANGTSLPKRCFFDPPRPSFAKEGAFRSTPSLLCQRGVFCPTCPSPAGGSLTHSQALALSKRARDVTALQCCLFRSTPSLLSQGGLHRFPQAPFPSGDRGCNRPPVLRTASL